MIKRIKGSKKIKKTGLICAAIVGYFVVWHIAMCLFSIYTNSDLDSVYITRGSIFCPGCETTYYSYEPWESYNESIDLFRFLRTSVYIDVNQEKKVSRIHYIPTFGQAYVLYLEDDGTVKRDYYDIDFETRHEFEEFANEFQWAAGQVEKTRKRYTHLIPENFKEALGIE